MSDTPFNLKENPLELSTIGFVRSARNGASEHRWPVCLNVLKLPPIILGLMSCAVGFAAHAEVIAVPSGQFIEFKQVIWDAKADIPSVTFRFHAPEISRDNTGVSYDLAAEDIHFLCENFALPHIIREKIEEEVSLTISLSQKVIAYGEMNPDITQFFENFVVRNAKCDWGEF